MIVKETLLKTHPKVFAYIEFFVFCIFAESAFEH